MKDNQSLILLLTTITLLTGSLLLVSLTSLSLAKKPPANLPQIPIGGSYQVPTLELFIAQALAADQDEVVTIRVLPITYPTDPYSITVEERDINLSDAQARADQILSACTNFISPTLCTVDVVNIQSRTDAFSSTLVAMLGTDVDGVFILGGDQTIAMQIIANTPTEDALETLHQNNISLGGTSAGAAVQSRYMIAGYTASGWPWYSLEHHALDLWYDDLETNQRGLRFGIQDAVIDQHVLERGRFARLLQATQQKPAPHLGLGVDWGTGVQIENQTLVTNTAGYYAALILDAETYTSAERASYLGQYETLSIRDVALHVLPEGGYGYNLETRLPVVQGVMDTVAPDISQRNFDFLMPPSGTGTLFVTGGLANDPQGLVTTRFVELAEATGQTSLVLAIGFTSTTTAQAEADLWVTDLGDLGLTNAQTAILTDDTNLNELAFDLATPGAIFVIGGDQEKVADHVVLLKGAGIHTLLHDFWQDGGILLLDGVAAAASGDWLSALSAPTTDNLAYEASDSFIFNYVPITEGLGLLPDVAIEPAVLYDYRLGRIISHHHVHVNTVVLGLQRATALEITSQSVQVIGDAAAILTDNRYVRLSTVGDNNVFGATWLFLDTFVSGQFIASKPSLMVNKTANPTTAHLGETITYTYQMTNTGPTSLTITAADDQLGTIPFNNAANGSGNFIMAILAPGQSFETVLTYVVRLTDFPGPLFNTAIFTGTTASGAIVVQTASASVTLITPLPANLQLLKMANLTTATVGETITYTYYFTNTGPISLSITANDDKLGEVFALPHILAFGKSTIGWLTYTVRTYDLPGPLVNTVTVTGTIFNGSLLGITTTQLVITDSISVELTPVEETSPTIYLPLLLKSL